MMCVKIYASVKPNNISVMHSIKIHIKLPSDLFSDVQFLINI